MRNAHFALRVGYDGAPYCGWQVQAGQDTVAGTIVAAAERLFREPPRLIGASRTDSGVHARDQRAMLSGETAVDADKLLVALNGLLPGSVRIYDSREVGADWHPKDGVFGKCYRYRIWCGDAPPPTLRRTVWLRRGRERLDIEAMNAGAQHLIGELDFEAFRAAGCQAAHAKRAIWHVRASRPEHPELPPGNQAGELIELEVRGNAFCQHQVRIIAGTIVDVGRGRTAPDEVGAILASRDRRRAGVTAPASGLTLWHFYDLGQEAESGIPSGLSWPGAPWEQSP